ncbi:DNA-binding response regulator [Cellulomonas hominis]|uniref:DNA-binding NarL/FixJ family response regulator n=1 Tax=Cellulomonas hominis TaxID=156981 RepID=A0A511FCV1_9CELL|nr:response regulator transcription factor [Cellulomonas hominis]MBB5474685.1 DNA-binding NarL/FixJ family response regulator [Cellulomonas hominis]NKY05751.1 response regulator transcription factor [Cellulomonas hominis]GEL47075.1 DNA-binding response regulator [Cellulomonas hominis]
MRPHRTEPDSGTLKVLVVDDHAVLRHGVVGVIDAAPDMTVAAEARTVAEAMDAGVNLDPDVALVDLNLPDGNGFAVVSHFAEHRLRTRCIMFTAVGHRGAVERAIDVGAVGYLRKNASEDAIRQTIRDVAAGRDRAQRTLAAITASPDAFEQVLDVLTPAERLVLEGVGAGETNQQIADQLGVVDRTVKRHVTSLLDVLGMVRRTQLAAWYAAHCHPTW